MKEFIFSRLFFWTCFGLLSCAGSFSSSQAAVIENTVTFNEAAAPISAQPIEEEETVEKEIQLLNERLAVEGQNAQLHLQLAEVYAAKRLGVLTVTHAQKAIELNPEQGDLQKAYRLAAVGYYLDGQFQRSVAAIHQAVALNPQDTAAKGFAQMLQAVDEGVSRQEAVQKIAEGLGSTDSEKIEKVFKEDGIGDINISKRYDYIIFDFGRLRFKTPQGWLRRENIKVSPFAQSLLVYNKFANRSIPEIGITKDIPKSHERTAIEFTIRVKQEMERKNIPGLAISDPIVVLTAGYSASFMEMTSTQTKSRSAWYQFLIDGVIISLQYTNTEDQYNEDLPVLKLLVAGMKVELAGGK